MTDLRTGRWGDPQSEAADGSDLGQLSDLDPDPDPDLGLDFDIDFDIDFEVDLDPDDSGPSGNPTLLRAARLVALVGVVGWAIAMAVNLLTPSNLLDTTDRDDEDELVVEGGMDDQAGIGGGLAGDAQAANLIAVDTGEGSTAMPADGEATGDGDSEGRDADGQGGRGTGEGDDGKVSGGQGAVGQAGDEAAPGRGGAGLAAGDYRSNLDLLKGATVRNRNHDGSSYRTVAQADLVLADHYGPRSDYLRQPGGNPERSFPVRNGGQFRASCEFSHFGYDDPLVFPGQPGVSHLHMFFGNTDVNAFTTHDTLVNSGSSTCNGQELNRTGYWVPAMFDGDGNVRVPERIVVYYKGEGVSRGKSEVYPEGAALIATDNYNALPKDQGGTGGKKVSFLCTDNFSTITNSGEQTLPSCDGSRYRVGEARWTVLEMNVKFPQCWNGQDPSDWTNFAPPGGDWYGSYCTGEFGRNLPNMEYFVNYRVDPGENTADWFLSSDVDPTSFGLSKGRPGESIHGDWWGGWHPEVNQMWIDNCVNYKTSVASGCGKGYLTDGGPNGGAPYDGPALQLRPEYTGPYKVAADQLFSELCPTGGREYQRPEDAAYCHPG